MSGSLIWPSLPPPTPPAHAGGPWVGVSLDAVVSCTGTRPQVRGKSSSFPLPAWQRIGFPCPTLSAQSADRHQAVLGACC